MDEEEKEALNAPFSDEDDNISEHMYDISSTRSADENKRIKTAIVVFVVVASLFAVILYGFTVLTSIAAQPQLNINNGFPLQYSQTMEITSAYAFQKPNNSSQASALAIIVQPYGTSSTNFTCRNISISLTTVIGSYANVYTTSDFVNSSTFNNTYDANFTNYQSVAPNCSIIELNGNGSQILQPGEEFAVFLNLNSSSLNCPLQANPEFTVQLTPSQGAKLTCTYSIPANITPVMVLSGS